MGWQWLEEATAAKGPASSTAQAEQPRWYTVADKAFRSLPILAISKFYGRSRKTRTMPNPLPGVHEFFSIKTDRFCSMSKD